jgi:predicted dehydrogenase
MSHSYLSRRSFVAAAAAAPLARAASDRISIGIIGTGSRGGALIRDLVRLKDLNFTITGLCDVWAPALHGAAETVQKLLGNTPATTTDYRELLARRDIDAVVIASPDYAHAVQLKHAVEAGKDVYCEKPMGTVFQEAKDAYLAVKKSKQVVQIGTQRRSDGNYVAAARLVQSGILGEITRINVSVNFQEPRWRRAHADMNQQDVDWQRFVMQRPGRPYDPRLLREWQLFSYNTNGIPGLWMSHFADVVYWFTGDQYPDSAVANGGVFLWKDGRETSDVFEALLTYPKGFMFSFAMSLTNSAGNLNHWHGTRGTLDMDTLTITGAGSRRPDRITEEIKIKGGEISSHMHDFLECVRGRGTPRADIEAGFSHSVAGTMASTALDEKRRVRFDRERLDIL